MTDVANVSTRTIRFHAHGEPAEVLQLEETTLPGPAKKRVRVKVHACGLNPADWALCRGLFAGSLPRGIGLEVAGTVDAIGEDVEDIEIGQLVFGPVDFVETATAGASDYAICSTGPRFQTGLTRRTPRLFPWQSPLRLGAWIAWVSKRVRRC